MGFRFLRYIITKYNSDPEPDPDPHQIVLDPPYCKQEKQINKIKKTGRSMHWKAHCPIKYDLITTYLFKVCTTYLVILTESVRAVGRALIISGIWDALQPVIYLVC